MALQVIIPTGLTEVTVNGLHQWDYGREIEIHADNLPGMVEVHFACSGMDTAVVRSCALIDGKVTAAIPDRCMEQTTPIVAWVYALEGRTDEITDEVVHVKGETILTIKLPITPRTKPQPAPAAPEEVTDKYTEAVAAMAELYRRVGGEIENMLETLPDEIEADVKELIEEGEIEVGKAKEADEAAHADEADYAKYALDGGKVIYLSNCLHTYEGQGFQAVPTKTNGETPMLGGVIIFNVSSMEECSFVMELPQKAPIFYSPLFTVKFQGKTSGYTTVFFARLCFDYTYNGLGGGYTVTLEVQTGGHWVDYTLEAVDEEEADEVYVSYKHIGRQYPFTP